MWFLTQHEVGVRNLEILNNTTDARGRKLEVVKVHCPPPLSAPTERPRAWT